MAVEDRAAKEKFYHEIDTGEVSEQGLCQYINSTPSLLSLLYDIDLMPEQWITEQNGKEWRQMTFIAIAWALNVSVEKEVK